MTVARTTLLDLPVITTGTESGAWGDYTNNGLTQYLDIAIGGISSLTSANFTTGALTIETTEGTNLGTNIVASSAQYATFRVSSLAQNSTITVGNTGASLGRSYRLINDDSTYTLTFKATGQTGVTLQPGQTALVAYDGTDYKLVGTIGPTVPVARGGTGATTLTANNVILGNGTSAVQFVAPGSTGNVLTSNGTTWASTAPAVVLGTTQTFTAAQTFRAANAIRSEAASTQDAIVIAGRAGGTSSYAATITPPTLAANITLTTPNQTATLGYINIPQSGSAKTTSYQLATTDVGEFIEVGSGGSITIPDATFSAGDAVLVFNNTSGGITITCTITTAYIAGTDTDKATVTLATRGVASILFVSGTVCVISGNVS